MKLSESCINNAGNIISATIIALGDGGRAKMALAECEDQIGLCGIAELVERWRPGFPAYQTTGKRLRGDYAELFGISSPGLWEIVAEGTRELISVFVRFVSLAKTSEWIQFTVSGFGAEKTYCISTDNDDIVCFIEEAIVSQRGILYSPVEAAIARVFLAIPNHRLAYASLVKVG